MADARFIVAWGVGSDLTAEWFSNTLYFAVDQVDPLDPPDYQQLADDIAVVYQNQSWTAGCRIEVRAYDMADPKPRPERAFAFRNSAQPTIQNGPPQVALCLSYYSERNLPRQRGRIYLGPFNQPASRPTSTFRTALITFGQALAGIGGLNVDWSVYSPTKAALGQDPTMTITNIWVDDSWDIIRSRKLPSTNRSTAEVQ